MPRESYAATVARHTAAIEDSVLTLAKATDAGTRAACVTVISKALGCIQEATLRRIERSDYEAQRRDGVELARLARGAVGERAGV